MGGNTYSLALCVPSTGRKQLRLEEATTDDVSDIVGTAGEHDGLGSQTSRADFRDQDVDDGADRHGVRAEPNETQNGLRPGEVEVLMGQRKEADCPEDDDEEGKAVKPNGAAAQLVDVQPGYYGAEERDARSAQCDAICGACADAGLLEEERPAVAEGAAVGDLGEEAHACDLGSAAIGTPEGVPELDAFLLLQFELVRMHHHGQCGVDLVVMVRLG